MLNLSCTMKESGIFVTLQLPLGSRLILPKTLLHVYSNRKRFLSICLLLLNKIGKTLKLDLMLNRAKKLLFPLNIFRNITKGRFILPSKLTLQQLKLLAQDKHMAANNILTPNRFNQLATILLKRPSLKEFKL